MFGANKVLFEADLPSQVPALSISQYWICPNDVNIFPGIPMEFVDTTDDDDNVEDENSEEEINSTETVDIIEETNPLCTKLNPDQFDNKFEINDNIASGYVRYLEFNKSPFRGTGSHVWLELSHNIDGAESKAPNWYNRKQGPSALRLIRSKNYKLYGANKVRLNNSI